MNKWLLLGGISLGVYYLWNKTLINYNIIGIKLNPARIIIVVYNPTNKPLTFNNILADILYNGNRIALLNDFNKVPIPPNGQQTITIPIQGDLLGFASIMQNIIQNGLKNVMIQIKGSFNVDNINMPLNIDYKIA